MISYVVIILFLPAIAFLLQLFFRKRFLAGKGWISTTAIMLSLALTMAIFGMIFVISDTNFEIEKNWLWIKIGDLNISFGFLIDNISAMLLFVVALIGSLIHVYSTEYVKNPAGGLYSKTARYFGILSLFTFSIYGIIVSNNFFMLFLFWELASISSFLMIRYNFENGSVCNGANRMLIINLIGDLMLLVGILLLYNQFGSFNFKDIFSGIDTQQLEDGYITFAGISIFFGVIAKSALFPLHVWLSDAMDAPIPVNAFMHATSLISAGIYLIIRVFPIFTPTTLLVMAYIGGFTALFAATIAATQTDIKQILAYSTVSQSGFMVLSLGIGAISVAFFHMITFILINALLFLSTGNIMRAMHTAFCGSDNRAIDFRDVRNLGGLKKYLPVTYWTFLICVAAYSGIPLTSGFLSKNLVLASGLSFVIANKYNWLLLFFGFMAFGYMVFNIFRLFFLTFHGRLSCPDRKESIHEPESAMTFPVIILSLLSLFVIYTFPHLNPIRFDGWIKNLIFQADISFGNYYYLTAIISAILILTAILLAWLLYVKKLISAEHISKKFKVLYQLLNNKYYFDKIYSVCVTKPFGKVTQSVDWFDHYCIGGLSSSLAKVFLFFSSLVNHFECTILNGTGSRVRKVVKFLNRVVKKLQKSKPSSFMFL